ncbi:MAG: class I SAM-dependent methyltransferase [Chloroflexi bacterium]|nr:class I SAM-dependent methyltransferase [Chloroflexota bacterium]
MTENKASQAVRSRYNRIAPVYDLLEAMLERRAGRWRELLWGKVEGRKVLEVGVGTGKNLPYYPEEADVTAIDFSERMLERARRKAEKEKIKVRLQQMDVQHLEFEDNTFDSVVATFVFCSVPDPVRGLEEVRRVCRVGGKVVLMEHVLSANRVMAWFMNAFNPLGKLLMGENMNRRTVENVVRSRLSVERVTDLAAGIFKLIEARKVA